MMEVSSISKLYTATMYKAASSSVNEKSTEEQNNEDDAVVMTISSQARQMQNASAESVLEDNEDGKVTVKSSANTTPSIGSLVSIDGKRYLYQANITDEDGDGIDDNNSTWIDVHGYRSLMGPELTTNFLLFA